jgi:hypothetical protein
MAKDINFAKLLLEKGKAWSPEEKIITEKPKTSLGEDIIDTARGVGQGASLGFSDEIVGGLESAFTDKSYEQARDESRLANRIAQERNAALYNTGAIGGSIGSGLIAGALTGGSGAAASAASLGRVLATGAGAGALDALGQSDAELGSSKMLGDVAIGAGLGGVTAGIGRGVGRAFQAGEKAIGKGAEKLADASFDGGDTIARKALQDTLNLSDDFVAKQKANPALFNEVLASGETQDDIIKKGIDKLIPNLEKLPSAARAIAAKQKATKALANSDFVMSSDDLIPVLERNIERLSNSTGDLVGKEAQTSVKRIQDLIGDLRPKANISSLVSDSGQPLLAGENAAMYRGKDIVSLLDRLASEANYDKLGKAEGYDRAVKELRSHISGFAKAVVPEYKSAMREAQVNAIQADRILKKLSSKDAQEFNLAERLLDGAEIDKTAYSGIDEDKLRKLFESRLTPSKVKDVKNERLLRLLQKDSSENLGDLVERAQVAKAINMNRGQGSTGTNKMAEIGGTVGSVLGLPGHLVGKAVGGILGTRVDRDAGKLGVKGLDYLNNLQSSRPQILENVRNTKYFGPLSNAAQRGGTSLAATNYILQQRDPEYRQLMNKSENP